MEPEVPQETMRVQLAPSAKTVLRRTVHQAQVAIRTPCFNNSSVGLERSQMSLDSLTVACVRQAHSVTMLTNRYLISANQEQSALTEVSHPPQVPVQLVLTVKKQWLRPFLIRLPKMSLNQLFATKEHTAYKEFALLLSMLPIRKLPRLASRVPSVERAQSHPKVKESVFLVTTALQTWLRLSQLPKEVIVLVQVILNQKCASQASIKMKQRKLNVSSALKVSIVQSKTWKLLTSAQPVPTPDSLSLSNAPSVRKAPFRTRSCLKERSCASLARRALFAMMLECERCSMKRLKQPQMTATRDSFARLEPLKLP